MTGCFAKPRSAKSTVDVAFILNTYATPRVASLFQPLDPYMAKDPIEDPNDLFPGLVKGVTLDGKLFAVPFRHASTGLHYNEEIFAERGIKGPPQTMEELVEVAKKCTYTRADGTPVIGMILPGVAYPEVIAVARAWDADFITPDMKVVANSKAMVAALTTIRDLYTAGAIPRNLTGMKAEDANTWMQNGRAAMAASSMSRNGLYNDPAKSQVAGKIKTTFFPVAQELKGKYEVAPTKVEFWSMAIPNNSKNKELAWSLHQIHVGEERRRSRPLSTATARCATPPMTIRASRRSFLIRKTSAKSSRSRAFRSRPSTTPPARPTSSKRKRRRPSSE